MKQKDILYSVFQTQVKNKDTAVQTFVQRALCMTSKMFEYDGLPETIPPVELEKFCKITETWESQRWTVNCMR